MPIAALLAVVTDFLIRDGVPTNFPLLSIAMAPVVRAGALLRPARIRNWPRPHTWRFFFLVILLPGDPQAIPPNLSFLQLHGDHVRRPRSSAVDVLPTADALRRRWYLTSAQAGCATSWPWPVPALYDEALFRDADRVRGNWPPAAGLPR